jgi:nucleoid DNA-binding protein
MAKVVKVVKKVPTKTEILTNIAGATDLTKKEVASVFDALSVEIKRSLSARGPGMFAIPGLLKIEKKKMPARPAKKGVPNPFKPGELMDVKARPAFNKIKVRPLKSLKDMV